MREYMDKTYYSRGFQDFSTMGHIIINPTTQAAFFYNNGKVKPLSYSKTKSPLAVIIQMTSHWELNENSVEKEIQRPILAGNRIYFAAISLFRSRLLSRATKIILYKTLIRPVVSYWAEAWTLTKKEEQALIIFERKIFRRIYDAKYENGEWKSRRNRELEEMCKGENIVKWIKWQRISCLGHLERMEEDRMPKKIFTQ